MGRNEFSHREFYKFSQRREHVIFGLLRMDRCPPGSCCICKGSVRLRSEDSRCRSTEVIMGLRVVTGSRFVCWRWKETWPICWNRIMNGHGYQAPPKYPSSRRWWGDSAVLLRCWSLHGYHLLSSSILIGVSLEFVPSAWKLVWLMCISEKKAGIVFGKHEPFIAFCQ